MFSRKLLPARSDWPAQLISFVLPKGCARWVGGVRAWPREQGMLIMWAGAVSFSLAVCSQPRMICAWGHIVSSLKG